MQTAPRFNFSLLLSGIAAVGLCIAAHPARALEETGIASPGRVEEQLKVQDFTPRVSPQIEVRQLSIQSAPAGADKIGMNLNSINLQGVTVYPEEELLGVYRSKLGVDISLADLYVIAADLTRKYRNDGYILTQVVVPPQTIEGGTARLQVVEGFIDNVDVQAENQKPGTINRVRQYAGQIDRNAALNVRDLERAMLLINDLPGMNARGILSPSSATPGAADLLIVTDARKAYDAQLSFDNNGSRFLGPVQLSAAGALNSLLGLDERVTGQFVYAPDEDMKDELLYLALGYRQPVGPYGTTFDLFGSATRTEPGYTLEEFDVHGDSRLFGLTVNHPFIRTRALNVTGRATFDSKNITTENNFEPNRSDKIRAARLGGKVEFIDTLFSVAYNMFDVELSRGIDILDSSDDADVNRSRPDAETEFFKIEAELQRLQRLTDEFNLFVAIKGQWAGDDALLSSEEFGVGGINMGRAFDPSEIIGDDGIAGKIELQWNEPYELSELETYQIFGFWDGGTVWNEDATAANLKQDTLTSAGLGVRVSFNPMTTGGLILAFPLNRDIATQQDDDPRLYFNVNQKF